MEWNLNQLDQDLEKTFEQLEEKYKHVKKEEEQKERYITVYEGMVKLTGKFNKAVMLQGLISWHKTVERMDAASYKEALDAKMTGDIAGAYQALKKIRNGWFWKTEKEMSQELMGAISPATCGRYFDEFIERGFLEVRKNTKDKTDHRNYYRVNIEKIRMELAKLGYNLDGYKFYVGKSKEGQNKDQVRNVRSLPQNAETGKSSTLTNTDLGEPLGNLKPQNEVSTPQNEVTSPQNEVSTPQNAASNTYINTSNKNTSLEYKHIEIQDINKQQQIQSGQAAADQDVVVYYQKLAKQLFGEEFGFQSVKTLIDLAETNGKDLAACMAKSADVIEAKKKAGEKIGSVYGIVDWEVKNGWDLDAIKAKELSPMQLAYQQYMNGEITVEEFRELTKDGSVSKTAGMNPSDLWAKVLDEIQHQVSKPSFDTWLRPTEAVSFEGDVLTINASQDFQAEWLNARYADLVESVAEHVLTRKIRVKFVSLKSA